MRLFLLLLMAMLVWGCQNHQSDKDKEVSKKETSIPVTIDTVRSVSKPVMISTTGLVNSTNTTKYSFKIGGVIQDLLVEEGDRIREGQVLAKLRLDEINAQVEQAELALAKSNRDFERVNNLFQDSVATLEEYQNIQTLVDVNQRSLDQMNFNRDYATIYAQNGGYVSKKLANTGEVIAPGAPVIISNDATSRKGYVLECSLNDKEWANVSIGDAAEVRLDAYPELVLNGRVKTKSPQANPVTGSFSIEIQLPPVSVELATGLYGKVNITTDQVITSTSIPYDALIQANGSEGFVYVITENGQLEKRPIEVFQIENTELLVSEGLAAGDLVVIGNNAFLSTRSNIEIIK